MANYTPLILAAVTQLFQLSSVELLLVQRAVAQVEFLNTTAIIERNGYPVESHVVTSEDGYLLTLHRIPGRPKPSQPGRKYPVLLHHGISVSSEAWVLTGPQRGLAFLLADEGYDVWMANSRGNFYSRDHLTIPPEEKKFWNFTWHEMGVRDLPAVIDHILATSKQPQLFYIGHSMGCSVFFVMTSLKAEYNKKVRLMLALAPAVFNGQHGSFSDLFSRLTLWGSKEGEIQRRTRQEEDFWNTLCKNGSILQFACRFLYYNVYGYNPRGLNSTLLPLYASRLQSGTSAKTLEHLVQIFEAARFQMYDPMAMTRGKVAMMPEYDFAMVTVPVVIFYGANDAVIRPKGIFRLQDALPNVIKTVRVADDQFNHVDFMFSNDVKRLVYDDVITLLGTH